MSARHVGIPLVFPPPSSLVPAIRTLLSLLLLTLISQSPACLAQAGNSPERITGTRAAAGSHVTFRDRSGRTTGTARQR